MRAREIIVAALCLWLGACAENHFAYVTDMGPRPDSSRPYQQLRLAKITDPSPPTGPAATDIATLMDTAIQDRGTDAVSSIDGLWVSPGNLRLAALVDVVGHDYFDKDLNAWNMVTGTSLPLVNELTVIGIIHRSTCRSAAFDAYLANLASHGTPQSELDSLDFTIPHRNSVDIINLPVPRILGWLDDTHLLLSWTLPFYTTPDHTLLQDTFLVTVTWPLTGAQATVTCIDLRPTVPHPTTALSADPIIRLNGSAVTWTQQGRAVPAPQARLIAGVISP